MYTSQERAHEFVNSGTRVRVHSVAIGHESQVMAEGKVIAYCAAPTLTIEHDDGTRSTWSVDLPIHPVQPTARPSRRPGGSAARPANRGEPHD